MVGAEEGRFALSCKRESQVVSRDHRHQNHSKNLAFQKDLGFVRTGPRSAVFTDTATYSCDSVACPRCSDKTYQLGFFSGYCTKMQPVTP